MNILTIGDIVGERTVEYLRDVLWNYRRENNIDMVVANGENASDISGIDSRTAKEILNSGVDVITGGNHTLRRSNLYSLLDSSENIVRPANYPAQVPGSGYTIVDAAGLRVLVINVLGTVDMESLDSPFTCVERIIERENGKYDIAVLDIHAEATSEKLAMARYFDGRIHIIFGTHTHIQTADESVLPGGSGYITDLGMSGPHNGVLGVKTECVLKKFLTKMPVKFEVADGPVKIYGAVFALDNQSRLVTSVTRVMF